jgi:hypothetical protein
MPQPHLASLLDMADASSPPPDLMLMVVVLQLLLLNLLEHPRISLPCRGSCSSIGMKGSRIKCLASHHLPLPIPIQHLADRSLFLAASVPVFLYNPVVLPRQNQPQLLSAMPVLLPATFFKAPRIL